jgi:AcrR family transcriptional regulator
MSAAVAERGGTEERGRKAPKATRRRQLIDATIDSLAKRGYADTTLADVAEGAGLSRGIVNFHFDSKDALLTETLRFLSDEYRDHWRAAQAGAGPDPAGRLTAIVAADFDRAVCTRRKLAAWCAFWGEAKSRPTYQAMCGALDQDYHRALVEVCSALAGAEAGPGGKDPEAIAHAIGAMTEGLWLRIMMGAVSREEGLAIALASLALFFPQHFGGRAGAAPGRPRGGRRLTSED